MALPESNFKNMLIALSLVTLVASTSLGLINEVTKSAIEKANEKLQNDAISAILPPFTNLSKATAVAIEGESDSLYFFQATGQDGAAVGTAVKSFSKKGFSGLITLMVGFDTQGNITGYKVLEHKETPGLGSKMQLWFSDDKKPKQNIIGKNPGTESFKVVKDGGSFDAITAATISSRAFLQSIQRAYDAWKSEQKQQDATASVAEKGAEQ